MYFDIKETILNEAESRRVNRASAHPLDDPDANPGCFVRHDHPLCQGQLRSYFLSG